MPFLHNDTNGPHTWEVTLLHNDVAVWITGLMMAMGMEAKATERTPDTQLQCSTVVNLRRGKRVTCPSRASSRKASYYIFYSDGTAKADSGPAILEELVLPCMAGTGCACGVCLSCSI